MSILVLSGVFTTELCFDNLRNLKFNYYRTALLHLYLLLKFPLELVLSIISRNKISDKTRFLALVVVLIIIITTTTTTTTTTNFSSKKLIINSFN
jgi:hypothetical protein